MNTTFKRLLAVTVGSIAIAFAGGGVIAQQAQPEAAPPELPVPPPPPGPGDVSEPEPAPNPVKERVEQEAIDKSPSEGGIDPELGPIAEPDAEDVAPALRMKGEGDWQRPQDTVRERVRRETIERAQKIERDYNASQVGRTGNSAASSNGTSNGQSGARADNGSNGLIMPRLMAPNIPLVPMELLFPPEVVNAGPPPVRESRGSAVIVGALDREVRTNTRVRIPAGGQGTYGTLRIKVSGCFMSHPEDTFESWAYVEVSDLGRVDRKQLAVLPQRDRNRVREATGERVLRKGWIIASSPSVTPVDHPLYDVWLINCEGNGGAGPQPQWPGGIAPPGQAGAVPPAGAATATGQAGAPAPSPTAMPPAAIPQQGKSTGN
jgi:hypothetical protein